MRRVRVFIPLLLLALLLCAPALRADDQEAPDVWTYRKGDQVRALDVTSMSDPLRLALRTQLEAQGWHRVEAEKPTASTETTPPEDEAEKAPPPEPPSGLRRDLEELVRRGGRLPEGFLPHGMPGPGSRAGPAGAGPRGGMPDLMRDGMARAAGRLILSYLDAKDDPVKGPIYEDLLRAIATSLTAMGGQGGADITQLGMRLVGNMMAAQGDPAKAAVYREIMGILSEALSAAQVPGAHVPAAPLPGAPPFAGPTADQPAHLAGATLSTTWATGAARPLFRVLTMPDGSVAQQMGLHEGDLLLEIDERPADVAGLKRAQRAIRTLGKLVLKIKRREGRIEVLDIEFEAASEKHGAAGEPAPGSPPNWTCR